MNNEKKLIETKKIYYLIPVVVFFLMGELVTRIGYSFDVKMPLKPPYNNAIKDEVLGWKMTPNYTFDGVMHDVKLEPYDVKLKYNQNGFKAYGDINTQKSKILFIGDSYTSSVEVANEHSFFNLIGDSLDVEIFAYGQSGYGTLQEYLILDQYVDVIQPDIILWQISTNDFVDNLSALEMVSGYKVGQRRPYLDINGHIVYEHPRPMSQKIMPFSKFLGYVLSKKELWEKNNRPIAEVYMSKYYEKPYVLLTESINITEKIIAKIKQRTPLNAQLYAFSADRMSPYTTEMKRLFEEADISFWMEPVNELRNARAKGLAVHSRDGYHWNNLGHQIIAEQLMKELQPIIQK